MIPRASLGPLFDGRTFEARHDAERLGAQFVAVRNLMADGEWRTLAEIVRAVGYSEAGVSARLRDLRKERFGGHAVERRRRGDPAGGVFEYRVQGRTT